MTRRRWIADRWDETSAVLTGERAAHLGRVLRAVPGMEFDVVAGERVWRAAITSVSASEVAFHLLSEIDADAALPVTLLLAVFKYDRFEWAIEKATELGVERIVPVVARRTEKHLAQSAENRAERWRRIVREAAQQSRRAGVPEIAAPRPLKTTAVEWPVHLRLLLSEDERSVTLPDILTGQTHHPLALAVGPEGGWAPEEQALLTGHGWKAVTLGPRILRAETAAIAALAIASALLD